ncbi:MAG: helix-turn-helix protein [Tenericutes bacterium ADurb.BinA155]|jgi:transcriptional regulator with XRE-family HTH domain|nr:MAG: helix-turn-helix protein [Tenericutes bacterium ADurb.BinA155]
MDKVKMGQFLAKLRTERNLRQQDEAEIFQISPQAISKWESGDSVPDIGTLEKLSDFYKVGIDEIINGEVKNPNQNVATVVVAKNPTMEDRGIGKPYYGAFIFCMSALLLGLILSFLPFFNIYVAQSGGNYIYASFNFYQVLFNVSGWPSILTWLMVLLFIPSACMSIGLWLDPNHRRVFWGWGFGLGLANMVMSVGTCIVFFSAMSTYYSNVSPSILSVGTIVLTLFAIAYFVLYCTLPITRKRTFCPAK